MVAIPTENNFDAIAAKIHAKRAAMYEKKRLVRLCELRSFINLAAELYPEAGIENHLHIEKQLSEDHFLQLVWILGFLGGRSYEFFVRLLRRYQLENIKIVFRGFHARRTPTQVVPHLITLPHPFDLPAESMLLAGDVTQFANAVENRDITGMLEPAIAEYNKGKRPFHFEAALDREWYANLLVSAEEGPEELRKCLPLLTLDLHINLVLFVLRVRNYGIEFDAVEHYLDLPQTLPMRQLRSIYDAADVPSAGSLFRGDLRKAITGTPGTIEELELMLAARQHRQAEKAYYQGGASMLAAVGWVYLKRVELANLIRLVESYRYDSAPSEKKQMMVPPLS